MQRILLIIAALILLPFNTSADILSLKTARGNIYSAGGTLEITETAGNDIVAAGGSVVIAGSAGNELLAAGGSIVMLGKTGGDARIAGGTVTLSGEIGGEAVIAGGKVTVGPKAIIASDLIAASGDMTLEGTIGGDVRIIGGSVVINGTIAKDAYIKANRLIIGKNAVIKGGLHYEGPQEARIEQGSEVTGKKTFIQKEFAPPRKRVMGFFGALWGVKLFATIIAALVIYFALREKTKDLTALALSRFGSELLIGFLVLIAIPAVIVVLFITVMGSLLGLISVFIYIAFIILSTVLGALVFSRLISRYLFKKEPHFAWPAILLGVLLYQLIGLIPFLGWTVKFVFFLSALGALSHLLYLSLTEKPSTPV